MDEIQLNRDEASASVRHSMMGPLRLARKGSVESRTCCEHETAFETQNTNIYVRRFVFRIVIMPAYVRASLSCPSVLKSEPNASHLQK